MTDRISIEDYRLLQEGKGKQSKAQKPKTDYKQIFLQQIEFAKLPMPELEVKFHASRKWRLDFAWPEQKIAVEYHGIFGNHKAGHQAVKSLQRDYEKANEAVLLGWLYLTITAETVNNGQALTWLERAFEMGHSKYGDNMRKLKKARAIRERKEYAKLNYDLEDDDDFTDDDAIEELMGECGQDRSGYCSLAGTEYCDWECPFSS